MRCRLNCDNSIKGCKWWRHGTQDYVKMVLVLVTDTGVPKLGPKTQTRDRLLWLLDTKGSGEPATFSGKEDDWREWSVKFERFVVGIYGGSMRAVLLWAAERDAEIADVHLKYGEAAPAADLTKTGQLCVALQQFTSKEAYDVLRSAPVGAGLEGWRRLVRHYDPSASQRKRVMLRSILNPSKATSVAAIKANARINHSQLRTEVVRLVKRLAT
eukprot:6466285-Amphidinium_carterae.1